MDLKPEIIQVKTIKKSIKYPITNNASWQSIIEKIQENPADLGYEGGHEIVCGGLIQNRTTLLVDYDFTTLPPVHLVPVAFDDETYIYLSYKFLDFTIHPQTTFLELKQAISVKYSFQMEDIVLQLMNKMPDDNQIIQQAKKEMALNDDSFEMFLQISVKKCIGIPTPKAKIQKIALPSAPNSPKVGYSITLKTTDNLELSVQINIERDSSTWGDLRKLVCEKTGILRGAQTSLTNNGQYRKDADPLSKSSNHCVTGIMLSIPYKHAFFIQQAQSKVSMDILIKHIRHCSSSSTTFFKKTVDTFIPDPVLSGSFFGFYYDQIKTLPSNAPLFTTTFLNHFTPELLINSLCVKPVWGMHIPDTYYPNRYQAMQDCLQPHTALGQKLYQGGKAALLMIVENLPETNLEQKRFKYQVAQCIVTNNCVEYKNDSLYTAFQETRYGGSIKPNEGMFGVVNRLYNRLETELYSEQDNDDFVLIKR